MRSHGVPSFPDPHVVVNTPGKQAIGIHPLPKSIASSPQFKAAQEACKGIMPAPENGSPKQQTERERARATYMLAFAQCLRSHGVPGFPDPTAQGQLTPEMIHAAGVDLQAPSVLTAAQACVGVTHGAITHGAGRAGDPPSGRLGIERRRPRRRRPGLERRLVAHIAGPKARDEHPQACRRAGAARRGGRS